MASKPLAIDFDREQVAKVCRKYGIKKLSIFGSTARGEAKPDSDIDLLVEFEEGSRMGFAIIRMEDELSEAFGGGKIDLLTPKSINSRIRDIALQDAVVIYQK